MIVELILIHIIYIFYISFFFKNKLTCCDYICAIQMSLFANIILTRYPQHPKPTNNISHLAGGHNHSKYYICVIFITKLYLMLF